MSKRHTYTVRELQFLRDHYPNNGAKWCAERLGLPRGPLAQFARKHGIRYDGPVIGFKKGHQTWNKGK